MSVDHGMDVEEIEQVGRRLQAHFAAELRRVAAEVEGLVGRSSNSWIGPDAEAFRSWWPSKRAVISAAADDIDGFGRAALNNVSEQREASGATGDAVRPGRSSTSADPFPVSVESSARESKSGAVVRGVDGTVFVLREMSDGSVQVEMVLSSGMEADIGDAVELAKIARGDFFSGEGIEWDVDVSAMQERSTTWTFSDPDSARALFEALKDKQDSLGSVISGLSVREVNDVISGLGDRLEGDVAWSGYEGGYRFTADGSVGVRIGDADEGVAGGIGLSGVVGNSVETVHSDGSTGEMSRMSGRIEGGGRIDAGPTSHQAAAGADWSREVHLIRDANGTPVRLEVTESFGVGAELGSGSRFLGTGSSVEGGVSHQVVNSQVFDLNDPTVSARFGADTDPSSLYDWAKDNASLGGQTVTTYEGNSLSSSSSLLFSGEWNTLDESSDVQSVAYRPPGGEFTTQSFEAPEGFENRQLIRDEHGNTQIVYTGSF